MAGMVVLLVLLGPLAAEALGLVEEVDHVVVLLDLAARVQDTLGRLAVLLLGEHEELAGGARLDTGLGAGSEVVVVAVADDDAVLDVAASAAVGVSLTLAEGGSVLGADSRGAAGSLRSSGSGSGGGGRLRGTAVALLNVVVLGSLVVAGLELELAEGSVVELALAAEGGEAVRLAAGLGETLDATLGLGLGLESNTEPVLVTAGVDGAVGAAALGGGDDGGEVGAGLRGGGAGGSGCRGGADGGGGEGGGHGGRLGGRGGGRLG